MSQEQGGLEARRKPESDLPLSPADPGRARPAADSRRTAGSVPAPEIPVKPLRIRAEEEPVAQDLTVHAAAREDNHPHELVQARIEWPEEPVDEVEHGQLAEPEEALAPSDHGLAEEDAWVDAEAAPEPGGGRLSNLRLKLRFHRADLVLGVAVVIAAVALLWPSGGGQKADLPPWERILIAMGIAEAPQQQPAVRFHGDPDLKVWVDTHTALYYCPGDELYGKSPDGHYTTQREAQADRFEPAERSVCIE